MKIYSTANIHDSIYHHTLDLLGIGITDTTTLPFSQFFRSANTKLRDLSFVLWKNSSDWEFDDSNYTTLPMATCNLVADQQDYSIPTTALSIERVEVKGSDGNFRTLKQIDKSEETLTPHLERYATGGLPIEYDIVGNSLLLFPTPSASQVTTTAGLRVYVSRDISEFATTDTTKEPGIPKMFHPAISYGVAYEFSIGKNMNQQIQQNLQFNIRKYERMLNEFIAKRNKDRRVRIRPRTHSRI